MILEQICRSGESIKGRPGNGDDWNWGGFERSYWTTSAGRMNYSICTEPYNTFRQSATKLLYKTINGKILNTYDSQIIRFIEKSVFTYKPVRCKLFACEWKNNDISL